MTVEPKDEAAAPLLENASPPGNWFSRAERWLTEAKPEFAVGTLRYTGFGMMMVFFWLLWGDFCFNLLDTNVPNIFPLKLKEMGATDTTNSVIVNTFASVVTFFLAPVVSFRSDRTRTRWGRRIPYLIWSTPFVGLFFVAIGYYDALTNLTTGGSPSISVLGFNLTQRTLSLIVIGALIVGWDIANVFVSTVYYYLFNDVVPSKYLSRFLALFRIVSSLALMAYNRFIFPHSLTHFRTIFVFAGIAYVAGFLLMCFFVREGSYPPPPPNVDRRTGLLSAMKTYAQECFTYKLYWFFFLSTTCVFTARLASMFLTVRNRDSLGLTMKEIGDYNSWPPFIALFLHLPAGWLADRFHPLRVYIIATAWALLGTAAQCIWIFRDFGHDGNLVMLYVIGLSTLPFLAVADAAELPMYMRLLPKDRYGQFASANGMIRALARIFFSVMVGMFIGAMAPWFGERRYTWVAGWQLFFQLLAILFLFLLYRQWKLHGGNTNYVPPGTEPAPPPSAFPVIQKH